MLFRSKAAGNIIQAFGTFVVGGNYVVGMVVFLILVIINFVVITKGAGRIAEVGARFTLDALPGKQMSIDADLRAGIISSDEAKRRREALEQESQLHGAMDGAMKFVKGDAIAGIIIAAINILAGIAVGALMHGMSIGDALHRYAILTVGDGMASQIPSLLVSIAAGIVTTRVATRDRDARHLGQQIGAQIDQKFHPFGQGVEPGQQPGARGRQHRFQHPLGGQLVVKRGRLVEGAHRLVESVGRHPEILGQQGKELALAGAVQGQIGSAQIGRLAPCGNLAAGRRQAFGHMAAQAVQRLAVKFRPGGRAVAAGHNIAPGLAETAQSVIEKAAFDVHLLLRPP